MDKNDCYNFYSQYHDQIHKKRIESPYPVRRQVHQELYERVLKYIPSEATVLDSGTGEGGLAFLLAKKGCKVTAIDLSVKNIEEANRLAEERGFSKEQIHFKVGNAAKMEFADNSFDYVVSNHVLEHLPVFEEGVREVFRITKRHAVIAVPTCLSLASWTLLGRSDYWRFRPFRSPLSLVLGGARTALAFSTGQEGVDEGYAGGTTHVFRFPWKVQDVLERNGFKILAQEAQTLSLPYLPSANQWLLKQDLHQKKMWRNMGLGTVFFVEKV